MNEQLDRARAALERLADRTGDGRFNRQDVDAIAHALEARADDFARRHTTAALAIAGAIGAAVGYAVRAGMALFGC